MQLECNMLMPSGQRYPSWTNYLKYTVHMWSLNHGHISSKCMYLCLDNGS